MPVSDATLQAFLQNVRTNETQRNALISSLVTADKPRFDSAVDALCAQAPRGAETQTDVYLAAQQRFMEMMHCCFMKEIGGIDTSLRIPPGNA